MKHASSFQWHMWWFFLNMSTERPWKQALMVPAACPQEIAPGWEGISVASTPLHPSVSLFLHSILIHTLPEICWPKPQTLQTSVVSVYSYVFVCLRNAHAWNAEAFAPYIPRVIQMAYAVMSDCFFILLSVGQ